MRSSEYNHAGLTATVSLMADTTALIAERMGVIVAGLDSNDDYAVDHAAERLEDVADQMLKLSSLIRNVIPYTNYPPAKAQPAAK